MYRQRDVVLLPFPYSDLTAAKQRPALILSNSRTPRSDDVICCLVTSNPTDEGIEMKGCFESQELPLRSWTKPHRVFTVHRKIIRKRLSRVMPAFHGLVVRRLNEFLDSEE